MVAVAVQLGPLVGVQGVLDRQGVQAELVDEHGHVLRGRLQQVQPQHVALDGQVLADLADREAAPTSTPSR